jgi:hypothetical protein
MGVSCVIVVASLLRERCSKLRLAWENSQRCMGNELLEDQLLLITVSFFSCCCVKDGTLLGFDFFFIYRSFVPFIAPKWSRCQNGFRREELVDFYVDAGTYRNSKKMVRSIFHASFFLSWEINERNRRSSFFLLVKSLHHNNHINRKSSSITSIEHHYHLFHTCSLHLSLSICVFTF